MAGEKRKRTDSKAIDSLPDDILLNILKRLEFRDAAATSFVSPRLLDVWTFSTHLDFREPSLSPYDFTNFVNFILNKHRGCSVDFLRIAFDASYLRTVGTDADDFIQGNLEKWIAFARSKSVRTLEVDLHHSLCPLKKEPRFSFPLHELDGLKTLTSLSLKHVLILDEDEIVYLLENSLLNLETLVIENAPRLKNLKLSAQNLKNLEIRDCPELRIIDIISAPNLESFDKAEDFENNNVRVSFCGNVLPKLSNVNLHGLQCHDVMLELQEYAPHLEKLELGIHRKTGNFLTEFPQLRNLKKLGLNFHASYKNDFMDLMFIISACPNLQDLTLNYVQPRIIREDDQRDHHWDKATLGYTHTSLATVTFVGCGERYLDFEFASYLMEIATNLRIITFDPNPSDRKCDTGYREWQSGCYLGKYHTWEANLCAVREFIHTKPYTPVAFRYALPRLLPEDWGVPKYEDWKEDSDVNGREYKDWCMNHVNCCIRSAKPSLID